MRQVRVAALPYEMPNRLVPTVGDDTYMIGSDWPHAEGVADPMAAAAARRGRIDGTGADQHLGRQRVMASRTVTIDLEAAASERDRLRTKYLQTPVDRPKSTAQGVHHVALLCSDVERTIRFYQELLGFPSGRAVREP